MKRIGFILKVKQHLIDEYKEHHRNVWEDMQNALRETGWHNYNLFIRDDGMLSKSLEPALEFVRREHHSLALDCSQQKPSGNKSFKNG
ncbi:MAG TPA: L-rhamnose mutarotase [Aggregatilineales bacterium]|nr:L-rhamnose mutarotase [Aggregatilineales bacterium]